MKKILVSVKSLMFIWLFANSLFAQSDLSDSKAYLSWNASQAKKIHESWRVKGRVGGFFDTRILDTDKSFNYKLRATLMSPEAVRAAARVEQINNQLSERETEALITAEENLQSLIVIVEIDPREGSGVVPNNWRASLRSKNDPQNSAIRGIVRNDLRDMTILKSAGVRDYDYDLFIVAFPLKNEDGKPFWKTVPSEIELTVGVYNKEGRVDWKVTDVLKKRIEILSDKKEGN